MISKEKKITQFQNILDGNPSEIESIIYTEAITLLNKDVNPDKVQNWVNNVLYCYQTKPKPLTDKQKKQKEMLILQKREKQLKFESLNNQLKNLIDEYGVYLIGFFDWKEMNESEYDLIETLVKIKGYNFTDLGEGAIKIYITKKEIDDKFIQSLTEINNSLDDFNKDSVLNNYVEMDLTKFRDKVTKLN